MTSYNTDTSTFANYTTNTFNSFTFIPDNTVKIRHGKHGMPTKATKGSAAWDLRADIGDAIVVMPNDSYLIDTGISVELPEGVAAMVLPRSGLAYKVGISLGNSVGLIDSDYRGTIKVLLRNFTDEPYAVVDGDRIAQLIFVPLYSPSLVCVEELSHTARGNGGFGSTGTE